MWKKLSFYSLLDVIENLLQIECINWWHFKWLKWRYPPSFSNSCSRPLSSSIFALNWCNRSTLLHFSVPHLPLWSIHTHSHCHRCVCLSPKQFNNFNGWLFISNVRQRRTHDCFDIPCAHYSQMWVNSKWFNFMCHRFTAKYPFTHPNNSHYTSQYNEILSKRARFHFFDDVIWHLKCI